MKQIILFLATNLAIVAVLSITLRLLGVDRVLDEQGVDLNLNALLVLSAGIDFWWLLDSAADVKMDCQAHDSHAADRVAAQHYKQWWMATVQRQAQQAGIGMPEVASFGIPDANAFATMQQGTGSAQHEVVEADATCGSGGGLGS